MEDFENISAREYMMWEENNALQEIRLIPEGNADPTDGTTADQYERVFADWDRWGDEIDMLADW